MGRGRSEDQVSCKSMTPFHRTDSSIWNERNIPISIGRHQCFNRTMQVNRSIRQFAQFRQNTLGFAKSIAEQNGWMIRFSTPPSLKILHHLNPFIPVVNRHCKSRLANEHIARDFLKAFAGWICVTLIISGNHPNRLKAFHPHLCRAQNMTCRMKADPCFAKFEFFAVGNFGQLKIPGKPLAEYVPASFRAKIGFGT